MIITLCGSARFEEWFHRWNLALSLAGHCVFGLSSYPSRHQGEKNWYSDQEKADLDLLHKRKIECSDAIFVVNAFAYIGASTLGEIEYAEHVRPRKIYFLESWGKGFGVAGAHYGAYRERAKLYRLTLPTASPISTHGHPYLNPFSDNLLGSAGPVRRKIVELLRGYGTQEP